MLKYFASLIWREREKEDNVSTVSSDLYIMLIGKTGAGKSKTGNSIFDRNAFYVSCSMDSSTMKSQKELTLLEDGRTLYVVDTPGVADTRGNKKEGEELVRKAIREAILMNPYGYHALIIVIRFGSKFTSEDTEVIKYLKCLLGEDFIKKHCIFIITYGDDFAHKRNDGEITVPFMEWCREQSSSFRSFLEEVQGRILLFNNRGTPEELSQHRTDLVSAIDKLTSGGSRYTDANFEEARKQYEKLVHSKKISELAKIAQDTLSVVLLKNRHIDMENDDIDMQISAIIDLKNRVENALDLIQREQNQTGVLEQVNGVGKTASDLFQLKLRVLDMKKELTTKEGSSTAEVIRQKKVEIARLREESIKLNRNLERVYNELRDRNNIAWAQKLWDMLKSVGSVLERVRTFFS